MIPVLLICVSGPKQNFVSFYGFVIPNLVLLLNFSTPTACTLTAESFCYPIGTSGVLATTVHPGTARVFVVDNNDFVSTATYST